MVAVATRSRLHVSDNTHCANAAGGPHRVCYADQSCIQRPYNDKQKQKTLVRHCGRKFLAFSKRMNYVPAYKQSRVAARKGYSGCCCHISYLDFPKEIRLCYDGVAKGEKREL